MVNFLKSNNTPGGYKVLCNGRMRGLLVANEGKYRAYRYLENGRLGYMGIMSMWEARGLFSALYL